MNPVLQEILHNITSRLAALEQSAQSDKLLIDLIQEQRAEIDRLRAAQPEQHHELLWQAGFAEGKQAAMNQFIRDECDRLARPKRWVGLRDEERRRYNDRLSGSGVAEEIEAKLKEKNA